MAILAYDGAQLAATHGLTDLFGYAAGFAGEHQAGPGPAIRITHWRAEGSRISCVHDNAPGRAHRPGALILPGSQISPVDSPTARRFTHWIRERHGEGAVLAAGCGGVHLLAETGLLDGRPATTHWALADTFSARFPGVVLDTDKLVIDDGDIITAGGVLAWANLGLHLVERLLGHTVMLRTARFMLVDPAGREQRFYSGFTPPLDHGDKAIIAVQHWLQAQSGKPVPVRSMAERAGLEERTFLRRFVKATGLRPTAYFQRVRIAKARELLEVGSSNVGEVATSVGYGDINGFRAAFKAVMGLSPSEYRRRFGRGPVGKPTESPHP